MKKIKKPSDRDSRRLRTLIEQFDYFFGTNIYKRTLNFQEKKKADSPDCAADIHIDRTYQRMTICIYPVFWTLEREEQRMCVLHEFCHNVPVALQVIAEGLQEGKLYPRPQIEAATEEVTSQITNKLDALLRGRNRFAKDAYAAYLK